MVVTFILVFINGSILGCTVGVELDLAPSFNSGSLLHYDSPTVAAVGVVGSLGMVRCAMFVSEVYLVMFLYVPASGSVLGVGHVCLRLYYCVVLQVHLIVVPMFYVWFTIVVGVCYVCMIVRSGVPIGIGGRLVVDFSICGAVFTS
jgi:hypothetical protein